MNFNNCCRIRAETIVCEEENKRKFKIDNRNSRHILSCRVDGCLVNDNRERCDWLFEIDDPCTLAIYVELKGCDIEKAIQQLSSTMTYLSSRHKNVPKMCFVICSRVPAFTTKIQQASARFKKQFGITVHIKCTEHTHTLA